MARTTPQEKARKTAEILALLEAHELGVQAIAAKVGCSTRLVMEIKNMIKNGNGNTENGNGNEAITITGLNTEGKIDQVTITPTVEAQTIPLTPLTSEPSIACSCGEDEVAGMNVKVWMALGAAKAALEWINSYKAFKKRPCKKRFEAAIELINEATI